jgi:hypothetical protein
MNEIRQNKATKQWVIDATAGGSALTERSYNYIIPLRSTRPENLSYTGIFSSGLD